jgi:hypothetical protein
MPVPADAEANPLASREQLSEVDRPEPQTAAAALARCCHPRPS